MFDPKINNYNLLEAVARDIARHSFNEVKKIFLYVALEWLTSFIQRTSKS